VVPVKEYDDEFLSLDLNVKVVAISMTLAHIREHGTQHSDAILTRTLRNADRFVNEVDSSAVYECFNPLHRRRPVRSGR
jgi:glutamate-5-semialdehyde dehydrogenase